MSELPQGTTRPRFSPGRLVATPGALEALEESGQTPDFFLDRHLQGDWGEVGHDDWQANDLAVQDGSRILSAYRTLKGVKIWILTEAKEDDAHRTASTMLLPSEY